MKLLDGIEHELEVAQALLFQVRRYHERRDRDAAMTTLGLVAEHAENAKHTAATAVLLIRGNWPMETKTETNHA
jgi:hypothetical protein